MSKCILQWLASDDTGLSSTAIALTALGEMPKEPPYPHDGDDFGRCYRLLKSCPDAQKGLEELGLKGGPFWKAIVPRWNEIELAYLYDEELYREKGRNAKGWRCYELMWSITKGAL